MSTPKNHNTRSEFNSGGPQYNNTGSGHQFSGATFNAPVHFSNQRDASHDDHPCLEALQCVEPFEVKNQLKEDKDKLLSEAIGWIFDDSQYRRWQNDDNKVRLLWIRGGAGTGKTMMTIGLIEKLPEDKSSIVTYFFCQNADYTQNTVEAIIKGLIWQLIQQRAELIESLQRRWDAVRSCFKENMSWRRLWNVFLEMLHQCPHQRVYIVVDALDECQNQDMAKFLKVLVRTGLDYNYVRWLLTSRPLDSADQELLTTAEQVGIGLELNNGHLEAAIRTYVERKVDQLYPSHPYGLQAPQGVVSGLVEELVERAEGTFLWVSLVCKTLEGDSSGERVSPDKALSTIQDMPPGLYPLYERMRTQITEGHPALVDGCLRLLEVMTLVYRPLEMAELPSVTGFSETEVARSVNRCASFLKIRGGVIKFVHLSCRDFWAQTPPPSSYDQYGNGGIALNCLSYMPKKLKVNKLNISPPNSTRQMAVEKARGSEAMEELYSMKYAATFWADHLGDAKLTRLAPSALDTDGQVMAFLYVNLLEWLECLSLLGELSHAIKALKKLESIAEGSDLNIRVFDANRFLLRHYHTISTWPIQIYSSAIVFSPQDSLARANHNANKVSEWLKRIPPAEKTWEPLIQTLEGHSFWVNAVAFSPDGKQIASGSGDATIRLWDISTGDCLNILRGHLTSVNAVAFSPDGKQLASASGDATIRLWDISADTQHPKILKGHLDSVDAVAFSPDGKQLASASTDGTIRLWDLSADAQHPKIMRGHSHWVNAIAFSPPDGKQIASASYDTTIQLWDTSTGNLIKILRGHSKSVNALAFSPSGKQIASASHDKTIQLWDISVGNCLKTLQGHSNSVNAVAFSLDGKQIASASHDTTIRLWDISTGDYQILQGHSRPVNAVAFAPNGKQMIASASSDNNIQLWDISMDYYPKTPQGHSQWVNTVVFSPDGKQIASASNDKTVRIWNTSTGDHQILRGHSFWVNAVAFSSDGKQIASASSDATVQLWNPGINNHQILRGHSNSVHAVAFAPYGKQIIASASSDNTIRLWDIRTGKHQILRGHSDQVNASVFSPDGKQIASASDDETIRLWDIHTGKHQILRGHSDQVKALVFSPDGNRIASASEDKTIRLWDVSASLQSVRLLGSHLGAFRRHIKCYHQINTRAAITSLKFSSNGQFLHTQSGVIKLGKTGNGNNSKNDLYLENGWICYRSTQIFRILPGLLPSCYDVRDDHIAVGCQDGRVLFLEFDRGKLDEIVSDS